MPIKERFKVGENTFLGLVDRPTHCVTSVKVWKSKSAWSKRQHAVIKLNVVEHLTPLLAKIKQPLILSNIKCRQLL